MIDGTYDLLISTPLGDKRGRATLATSGDALSVDLKVAGFPSLKGSGMVSGNAFRSEGRLKIPIVGAFDYAVEGTVVEGLLEAVCHTSKGDLQAAGVLV